FDFELNEGERVFLNGKNGCGKSTFINAILSQHENPKFNLSGELKVGAGLVISYVNQDTGFLQGDLKQFCIERGLDQSLFYALLRQMDMERVQFTKQLEDFSEGQKKKVLIAASLITPAHLYLWDEPLNYIDVYSRIQIEELLLEYKPTMILVDHDIRFQDKIATRVVEL
ncbi:MAG: ABC-F family ATP-binding cassette domain-containing protein, partial [Clostridiales bacterium]|nr:ABC-F family ATP-binding cassette domain-containing protein [Clostridiales bacterium]